MATIDSKGSNETAPRWAALIDDIVVWAPQRKLNVTVLKEQGQVEQGRVLVRDHNSPEDVVLKDDLMIDLSEGNVFYTLAPAEVEPRGKCGAPPKLAFFVDDRPELVTLATQTGSTLRSLFNLPPHTRLVRDFEGKVDKDVELKDSAAFADGPVFYTRKADHGLSITVNARVFTEREGVKAQMTGLEVAALVYPENAKDTTIRWVSEGNREVPLTEKLHIRGGEVFDVVRNNVTGGFETDRVGREVATLLGGQQKVTHISVPVNAVVYHDLRTQKGAPVATSDVFVLIPPAYPGQMLDGAYLPESSPLIGRVLGEAQDPRVDALGRRWRLISYHPHNGGGGPAWNPGIHGIHTYVGELLSWLQKLR